MIRMVFSGWCVISVVCDQGGLFRVVCDQVVFSGWCVISVMCDQGGFFQGSV